MLYSCVMTPKIKTLLMTMAYQRQQELQVAMHQLAQALQMTKDPGEQQFLTMQRGQMEFMLNELGRAIQDVEKEDKKPRQG